jgi:microcystin-dependent protein
MPTALPATSSFTGAGVTEGDFKSAMSALRDFLSGLLGTDGSTATALATLGAPLSAYVAKSGAYTLLATDKGKVIDCTGTWTLTGLAAATAGDGYTVTVRNGGSGVITFDPNLSETVDGASTLTINAGETVVLYCNASLWVSLFRASGVPSGAMMGFAGGTTPSGWLLCDGSAISRTTYASLFTAIGTTHGVGDGSTTFNLPDSRGRVVVGKDNMGGSAAGRVTTAGSSIDGTTLGATGGAQNVTLTAAQSGLVDHSHGGVVTGGSTGPVNTAEAGTAVYSLSSGSTGSSGSSAASSAHTNMPPALVANVIIKA